MTLRKPPTITLIAAMSAERVIGADGKLPWHQPKDLQHFKACTQGKPIVMGRKTYESIGSPLPKRINIVVTRNADFYAEGVVIVSTVEDAIASVGDADEVMVVGGGTLYEQMLDAADALELTVVHTEVEGDTYFPDFIHQGDWVIKRMMFNPPDNENTLPMTFMRFEKAFVK